MKNLKQALEFINTTENTLLQTVLSDFIKDLSINLLDEVDVNPICEEDFTDKERSTIKDYRELELSCNSSIELEFTATCNFEYAERDEDGLYSKGDIIGCNNIECDINKVTLYLFDGSEFNLTDQLGEYFYKRLK